MADPEYVELDAGSGGEKIATEQIGGFHYQIVKMAVGVDGSVIPVSDQAPLPVSQSAVGTQNMPLFRYLDTVGDGSGSKAANGDYSSTQGIFRIKPAASTIYRIARIIVCIEDTSGFQAQEYGNIGAALTNGVKLRIHNGTTTVLDLTDAVPVKTNALWASMCYDADLKTWGSGNEMLVVRWTFKKAGMFLRLDGDQTEELQIVLDDDLTGLISHQFFVQGYVEGVTT